MHATQDNPNLKRGNLKRCHIQKCSYKTILRKFTPMAEVSVFQRSSWYTDYRSRDSAVHVGQPL